MRIIVHELILPYGLGLVYIRWEAIASVLTLNLIRGGKGVKKGQTHRYMGMENISNENNIVKLNKTFKFVNYFLLSLGCSAPQYWATSLSIVS